jgi:hypothetical protein
MNPPRTARPDLHLRALRYLLLAAVLVALVFLTACGGGDPDDDQVDVPTPSVNCTTNPEACK